MTYTGYLAVFLFGPLLVLAVLHWRDLARMPAEQRLGRAPGWLPWLSLLVHVTVAVIYTTPWDNYLVATDVWWYDPARIIGATIGWVPVEEYGFFVLQTLMTGLWLLWLMPRLLPRQGPAGNIGRWVTAWRWRPWLPGLAAGGALALVWVVALAILWAGPTAGAYLALEVGWFLPPIIMQVVIGGDILWRERRLVLWALLPPVTYLAATDAVAIASGVWTISPLQTVGVEIGGSLPVEELVFFTLTNTLIVFGMLLVVIIGSSWAEERAHAITGHPQAEERSH